MPYFLLNNQTGTDNPLFAQIWWPSYQHKDNYIFTDFNGGYSPEMHDSNTEAGIDYRHRFHQQWALGLYHYFSFNYSAFKQSFFAWNPGIEFLNKHWQINWNGYLPLSQRNKNSGEWVWADSVGIYDYIHFAGHNQYNQRVRETSSTGSGTDLIISYRFNKLANLKASLGAYYFDMPKHPVGVVIKLATPVRHHLSFSLSATHDPLTSNSINFGISVHFGNDNNWDNDWINQPVQHNLPLTVGANTIPISNSYQPEGVQRLQKDNVWFFATDGTPYSASLGLNNCTAENPCSGLTSTNLANIAATSSSGGFSYDPSIYLAPGTYSPSSLLLFSNESLIGRTADYKRDANIDNRATINTDTLLISGSFNTNNTIANIQLTNTGSGINGVALLGTQTTTLNNILIQGFTTDINADGASNLIINNSTLNATATGGSDAAGIYIDGDSTMTINNTTFNQTVNGDGASAYNIFNEFSHTANVTINDSILNTTLTSNGSNGGIFGILLTGDSTLTMNNSTMSGSTTSTTGTGGTTNIDLYNTATATINNSTLLSNGSAATQSGSTNITTNNTANATINNSTLETDMAGGPEVTAASGAVPLWALGGSIITVNNTNITARALNSNTVATPIQSEGSTTQGATVNINDSHITAYSRFGNTTNSDNVLIVAGNSSRITMNNNSISAFTGGNSAHNLIMVQSEGTAQITMNNNALYANNGYTGSSQTIGLNAIDSSIIYNNSTSFNLQGNAATNISTSGSGQIIN